MKTEFVIVTGISGAGKSCAVNVMEDIGYFCIDNMPPQLIPKFAEICEENDDISKVAIVTDIRGGTMFLNLSATIAELKKRGLDFKLLFVDANHHVVKQRYRETRRKHPLFDATNGDIDKAIDAEREILEPLREIADYYIDTSLMSTSTLKENVRNIFLDTPSDSMTISCILSASSMVCRMKPIWYLMYAVCRIRITYPSLRKSRDLIRKSGIM